MTDARHRSWQRLPAPSGGVARRRSVASAPTGDSGFSLIELVVTMVVAGLLMVITVSGWRAYAISQAQRGAADSAVALLREGAQRAITESRVYAVSFATAAGPWTLRQNSCAGPSQQEVRPGSDRVTAAAITFPSACVVFKPRGTATDGSLRVVRVGSTTTYRIDVEGLTGRVSIS